MTTNLACAPDIPPQPDTPFWDYETLRVFYEAGRADALAELATARW
jgi:hypothetical protein